ncbi:hypothetical protein ASE74_15090 [Pedobacter sp. Leaf216]|uniref:hypothetical protein n=1 Tax=Pedobacter sp. Leaf216 TaxID=1735684 RepID=UPI0006FD5292|nr:hypothetical protein [Pedobacter sp. Leaf216]KQM78353.1 hypothetical protein ASE74_15090 [Pedobacter sp. Leaf216]
MHTILPFLLAIIAIIVLLNMWATKLKIAYPILLVIGGLVISFIPGLPKVKIDPNLIFFIFRAPGMAIDYRVQVPNTLSSRKC